MDFERLGRRDLADQLLRSYGRYSAEDHPHSLEHHYIAYRALVRAKVSCLKGSSERRLAASYLELCHRHLTEGSVRIVLVGGLPGSGKTTLATALGDELGWTVLRSDEVRKERAGLDVREPAPAHFEQGLYAPEATADTYRELCDRAGTLVSFGESVVLDASFARADQRALMAEVAARTSSRSVALRCVVPREVASVRLARRAASATDASDADVAVMSQMAAHFAEWPDATLVDMVPDVRHVLPALIDQIAGHAPLPR
jgi:predicted kinase